MIFPLIEQDFNWLELQDDELETLQRQTQALSVLGSGWTLIYDERVICIGGFIELWEGVYELWIFPSYYVSQYSIIFLRSVKRMLKEIWDNEPVHRVQTHSIADDVHDKWMLFLGFDPEGYHSMFSTDKKAYRTWSIVRDGW